MAKPPHTSSEMGVFYLMCWLRHYPQAGGTRPEEEVSALTFIGRMVQHILPKGFHRIRYDGLHATCKAKKVKGVLTALMVALGRLIKGTYRIVAQKTSRDRVLASTGRDPLRCARCGGGESACEGWGPP